MPIPSIKPTWLKWAAIAAVAGTIIGAAWFLRTGLEPPPAVGSAGQTGIEPAKPTTAEHLAGKAPASVTAEEARREAMAGAYAGLEQDRHDLGNRLGLIRTQLWGVKMKVEESERLKQILMQGYAMLKDPPLLGAFSDTAGIEQERARLQAVESGLDEFTPVIDAARAAADRSAGR